MLQKISLAINAILIIAVAWLFVQHFDHDQEGPQPLQAQQTTEPFVDSLSVGKDVNAKIAYFEMDSIVKGYALMKDKTELLRQEEQRLTRKMEREQKAAQARYNELVNKDRTYSTQAEMQADEAELQELMIKLQQLEESSMNDLMALQQDIMVEVIKNLQDHLTEYNKSQGFDYIISVQQEGQIWTGNPSLDITQDVLSGLNSKYLMRKEAITPKAQ